MWIDDSGDGFGEPAPVPAAGRGRARSDPEPAPTPAVARFRKCRWSVQEEEPEYCSNPDVLPYAGKSGFNAEAWCPDCTLYKLRRQAPKRRRIEDDDYPY